MVGGELRSAVRAEVTLGGVRVAVAATHLDVHDEAVRCAQYEQLAATLSREAPGGLLGDFNALRPDDYDPRRRLEITEKRRDAGLDPPDDALMRRLDAEGWYDLVRLAALGGGVAGYREALGESAPAGVVGDLALRHPG